MYETIRSQLPPELTEAIDRAAAETTTEDVTLEGLKASVDGDVDIDKDKWVSALNESWEIWQQQRKLLRKVRLLKSKPETVYGISAMLLALTGGP